MQSKRSLFNFNSSWKFHYGDIEEHNINTVHAHFKRPEYVKAGNHGLAYTTYDDSSWNIVDLPHDFVIERNEYDTTTPSCTGSFAKSIVWYRKTFLIPEEDRGSRIFIQFDGVYRNCEVWLNGNLAGRHVGGYMGFELEITELLKYGSSNSFAVKVDATDYEGWWYEGGGIYRDVRVLKTNQTRIIDNEVHAEQSNILVDKLTATISISGAIDFGLMLDEPKSREIIVNIYNPDKDLVATKTLTLSGESYDKKDFRAEFDLKDIKLWSLEQRNLYKAEIIVKNSRENLDNYSTTFGIRTIKYSAERGFELNNKTVKLYGVCGHDDFAGVGVALTRPIIQYKIDRLMEMGVNAYRCAHNPPDPKFLEICDRVGVLVIDETRLSGVNSADLDDYVLMIKRDRNHPSIIAWSMGNEEMALQATEVGVQIFQKMEAIGKKYDSSRPYLHAINADYDRIVKFDRDHGFIQNPVGLNYFVHHDKDIYNTMHNQYPDLCMINTETTGICSTREYSIPYNDVDLQAPTTENITVWESEKFHKKITCYGSTRPIWGMDPETSWKVHVDRPYSAGVFLWTGFDYRGEVFPYDYPATITFFGIIDLCGIPKDWFYYLQANWTNNDVLHILPHWNMSVNEGETVDVWAFTNCEEVELYINGESQGRKVCEPHGHLEWSVKYKKGVLEAVGYKNGLEVKRDTRVTAKDPVKLVLKPNKNSLLADYEDAVIITAHLEDEDGNMVITSNEEISFEFEGPYRFLGTGNGDHLGSEPDKEPKRSLFAGKCIVIVGSTYDQGNIKVKGNWGNKSCIVELKSKKAEYLPIITSSQSTEEFNRKKAAADGGF